MNGVGRQGQRSGAPHHQRQYSDNFLESSSNGRWLQSAGLQHLQSNSNSSIPPPSQDYGYYGGGGGAQGSRMYRNGQRGYNEYYMEPSTPPYDSRRKDRDDSPNEFSPGLLDLHSFDTELIPDSINNKACLFARQRDIKRWCERNTGTVDSVVNQVGNHCCL